MHLHDATGVSAAQPITVRMRLFARYADMFERRSLTLDLPAGATAGDAVRAARAILSSGERLPEHTLVAVNRRHVSHAEPLASGDEVALLPPLAGG